MNFERACVDRFREIPCVGKARFESVDQLVEEGVGQHAYQTITGSIGSGQSLGERAVARLIGGRVGRIFAGSLITDPNIDKVSRVEAQSGQLIEARAIVLAYVKKYADVSTKSVCHKGIMLFRQRTIDCSRLRLLEIQ